VERLSCPRPASRAAVGRKSRPRRVASSGSSDHDELHAGREQGLDERVEISAGGMGHA
jgi:hypothetical protein